MKFYNTFLLSFFILLSAQVFSQVNKSVGENKSSLQYGFSLKALMDLWGTKKDKTPDLHISFNAGIGYNYSDNFLYPTINIETDFYNGGIGSKNEIVNNNKCHWYLDFITAFTITAGTNNNFTVENASVLNGRNVPLYYFTNFVTPALQNPFNYSISLGTNLIFPTLCKDKKIQRIGFINTHFNQIQFSYYNDGGALINQLCLGDGYDRYHTGGFVLSYHPYINKLPDLYELSYKKFTGYSKNAFEVSNKLNLNFISYHNTEQRKYNNSLWSLRFSDTQKGYGIGINYYNSVKYDLQHFIHWNIFNTYHMVPYKPQISFEGMYDYANTKIGVL